MDWREAAKEAMEDIHEDGLRGGLKDLHQEYMLDQNELGKILVITSLALMTVSIPSALTLDKAHSQIESASSKLSGATSVIKSDAYQASVQELQQRVGGNLAQSLSRITTSLNETSGSVAELSQTEDAVSLQANYYRWLSLFSIVGLVSGIGIIYV